MLRCLFFIYYAEWVSLWLCSVVAFGLRPVGVLVSVNSVVDFASLVMNV